MRKRLLRWLVFVTIPVVFTSCQLLPEEAVLPEIPVVRSYEVKEYEQTIVKRGDLILDKNISCTYMAAKEEKHGFSIGGQYVDKIYVSVGQHVKKGDLLAELEQENLQEQMRTQTYELKRLELQKEHLLEDRQLDLLPYDIILKDLDWEIEKSEGYRYEQLLVNKEEQEKERAKVEETYTEPLQDIEDAIYIQKLMLEDVKQKIRERQIFAAIDGTVTYARTMDSELISQKGQTLVTISDLDTNVFVIEGEQAKYFEVGEAVSITCFQKEYAAKVVDASELGIDNQEGDEVAYLKLDMPDLELEDGVTGRIQLILEHKENVLYIDKKLVKTANGESFVYVMDENGLRTMQPVTTGLETSEYIEIVDGLKEGDLVIVS